MGVQPEAWFQNERELKRERRKQSNRESARRSRLRKQAESEDLAHKVEALIAENVALKSEIGQFAEKSEKLRVENAALMEKMKNAEQLDGGHKQITSKSIDDEIAPTDNTENLLSKVDNISGTVDRNTEGVGETYEKNSNPNTKLHQLLDTSPRSDAVTAG
jgi:plant G-box-binding factor